MYLISNQEHRDIIRMLEVLKQILPERDNSRRANMARIAGVLIRKLERKEKINNTTA